MLKRKKLKICHITYYYPGCHRNWAGAEMAAKGIVETLEKSGEENYVLFTKPVIKTKKNQHVIRTWKDYLGRLMGDMIYALIPYDPIAYHSTLRILKKIKPDVVHLHNFGNCLGFGVIKAAKKLNIPVVFSIYDYWALCPIESLIDSKGNNCSLLMGKNCIPCIMQKKLGLLRVPFLPFRTRMHKKYLQQVDRFLLLSKSWAPKFVAFGIPKEKLVRVPLPIPEKEKIDYSKIDYNSAIIVATVQKRKGAMVAVKAMVDVLKSKPDAKLTIVGPDGAGEKDYKKEMLNIIKKANAEDRIKFVGKKTNEETRNLIKKAGVMIVAEQWEIAWPIALTEGMLYQKPSVCGNIGGIPEFIDNKNGFLVKFNEPEEYAKKLKLLLGNKKLCDKMGKAAQNKILSMCSREKIYKDLIASYNKVTK